MAWSKPAWAWESAIITWTATWISSRRTSPTTLTFCTGMTARAVSKTPPSAQVLPWRRASSGGARASWTWMGVGVGDYNLDGNLDIFKTHFADDTNILYRNDGKGSFEDTTISAGLAVIPVQNV